MAGKRQHFIWQHIQRGFAVNEFKDHHLWVYREDGLVERTVTRLHGQEKFFYGPEGSLADKILTDIEADLSDFVSHSREAPDGANLDPRLGGLLVAATEVRSAFLRLEFSRTAERLLLSLKKSLSSPAVAAGILKNHFSERPQLLTDKLLEKGIPQQHHEFFTEMLLSALPGFLQDKPRWVEETIAELLDPMVQHMATIAKEGHIAALEKGILGTERIEAHQRLKYRVKTFMQASLILPDTGLAFLLKDKVRPMSQKGETVEEVLIPISSTRAIVASRKPETLRPLGVVNSILASCTFKSFIARENRAELSSLIRKIGSNARLLSEAELSAILRSHEQYHQP